MKPRTAMRTVVMLIALVAFATSATVGAQPATPPVGHEAHHAGTPVPTEPATMSGMDDTPAPGDMMQMGEFDLMFIDMMTLHHQGAVAMAEVAVERGENPEVIDMARKIIQDQEEEIAQLQAWRDAWYPDAPSLSMKDMMGGMGDMMDPVMAAEMLHAAPAPFDLAFINAMVPHHLGALMMAEMAIQQATRPELASAAQAMFDMQIDEIHMMRAWRAEWYGVPATPAS